MGQISKPEKKTFYIAHDNDSVFHGGSVDSDLILDTGMPFLEEFDNSGDMYDRYMELSGEEYFDPDLNLWDIDSLNTTPSLWLDPRDIDYKTGNSRVSYTTEYVNRNTEEGNLYNDIEGLRPSKDGNSLRFDGSQFISNDSIFTNFENSLFVMVKLESSGNIIVQSAADFNTEGNTYQKVINNESLNIEFDYKNSAADHVETGVNQEDYILICSITTRQNTKHYINGDLVNSADLYKTIQSGVWLGGWNDSFITGNVKDVISLNHPVSDSERLYVEGYIAHANNKTSILSVDHPFKTTPPTDIEPIVPDFDIVLTDGITGDLSSYSEDDFTYSSTIDSIDNLYGKYSYNDGFSNQPIVVYCHGWNSQTASFSYENMREYSQYGCFVVSFGMRGKDGADGERDASGRELYDVLDGINYIKETFSSVVNVDKISLVGFSAGGGNALNLACKAPDLFNSINVYFPVVDYGEDDLNSWRATNYFFRDSIIESVGDPVTDANKYKVRNAINGIKNYKGGFLQVFTKTNDSAVDNVNTRMLRSELVNINYQKFKIKIHSSKFDHTYFTNEDSSEILDKVINTNPWSISSNGFVIVMGFIKTRLFEIELGNLDDHMISVSYDIDRREFLVTPLTGSVSISIRIGDDLYNIGEISEKVLLTL